MFSDPILHVVSTKADCERPSRLQSKAGPYPSKQNSMAAELTKINHGAGLKGFIP